MLTRHAHQSLIKVFFFWAHPRTAYLSAVATSVASVLSPPQQQQVVGGEGHPPSADPLPSLAQYLTQKLNYENMAKDKSSP